MNSIKINCILFILLTMLTQSSIGQNLLLLSDKTGKNDVIVRVDKKVKVKTINKETIKGKITYIKDSTIIIGEKSPREINIGDIKYFYVRKADGWKTATATLLALTAVESTIFLIQAIESNQKTPPTPGTIDNPVTGLIGLGAITIPATYLGTYYGFFHNKKYDTRLRYALRIIKP